MDSKLDLVMDRARDPPLVRNFGNRRESQRRKPGDQLQNIRCRFDLGNCSHF
jgi:hypothetical protein